MRVEYGVRDGKQRYEVGDGMGQSCVMGWGVGWSGVEYEVGLGGGDGSRVGLGTNGAWCGAGVCALVSRSQAIVGAPWARNVAIRAIAASLLSSDLPESRPRLQHGESRCDEVRCVR